MKKITIFIFAALLSIFTSCGANSDPANNPESPDGINSDKERIPKSTSNNTDPSDTMNSGYSVPPKDSVRNK